MQAGEYAAFQVSRSPTTAGGTAMPLRVTTNCGDRSAEKFSPLRLAVPKPLSGWAGMLGTMMPWELANWTVPDV